MADGPARFSPEWYAQSLAERREREKPVMCSVHHKTKAVASFVDELSGYRVNTCKRCRWKFKKLAGWKEER